MNTEEAKLLLAKIEDGSITPEEELQLWQELNKSVEVFRKFIKQLSKQS